MIRYGQVLFLSSILLLMISPILPIRMAVSYESTDAIHDLAESDFKRGPVVFQVTNYSALIYWTTENATDATVDYGREDSNLNMSMSNVTLDIVHRIVLDGLEPDTVYYYQATSDTTSSPIYHFKTAPRSGDEFILTIIGDNRPDQSDAPVQPQVFKDMIDMIILEQPHLVIMTGDCVYRVTTNHEENLEAWKYFTDVIDKLGHYAPIYGVIGNHDTGAATGTVHDEYFLDAFQLESTYYSFDYAGNHFTVLDAEEKDLEGRITGPQYDWFLNDLESTDMPMKWVISHRPLYPCSHIGSSMDVNITERDMLQDLFEMHNVSFYVAGHDHLFNRITVNGVTHFISGGGGGPLYSTYWGNGYFHYLLANVSVHHASFAAIKFDGTIIHEYEVPYTGPIEIEIRPFGNHSSQPAGTVPKIYFSETPAVKYFSWDGATNSSSLIGIPNIAGERTLDIYAQDDEGRWSHARYLFTSFVDETTSSSLTTPVGGPDMTITLLLVGGGVAAVVILVVIWRMKSR